MTDIVGTLAQPHLALIFMLSGSAVGAVCAIIKAVFSPSRKLTLVLGDLIATLVFATVYIYISFINTRGVVYVYSLLSSLLGYGISYFLLKRLIVTIVKIFKKSTPVR